MDNNIIDIARLGIRYTQPRSLLGVDDFNQLVRVNNEVPELQTKINEIQSEIDEIKESNPSIDNETINALESRVGRLEVEIDDEKIYSRALASRLETAENDIDKLEQEITNIKENPSGVDGEILNQMQQEINALTSQIGYLRRDLDDINEKLERNNIV